ncbi:MAG: hypothetical protein QF548_02525 [Acidimicrobiales bacterium]|jgi:hypothetical protein|nr:hypothetical protein [Acidimicrobiales bacterium]
MTEMTETPIPEGSPGGPGEAPDSGPDETASPVAALIRRVPLTRWVDLLIVLGGVWFVLWVVNPDGVLFTRSTPTGGDLGAHVWGPAFLRDELLPRFRLTGWTPDWYAGFPAYHFYMVVPMLLVVAVDVGLATPLLAVVLPVLLAAGVVVHRHRLPGWPVRLGLLAALVVLVVPVHYGMAVKWVTVAGLVVMPVAGWAAGRLAGLPFPGPALTSVATLPFLFDQSFNIMGGNLMSTMAGEFAYALAMAACLVYLGLLVRGMETGRGRAPAAAVLALTGLCHLLVAFFALVASLVAFALRPSRQALRWLVTTGLVSGLCAAFWVLPFWWRRDHLNDMAWHKLTRFRSYLWDRGDLAADFLSNDPPLQPAIVLAVVGLVLSVAFRRRFGFVLAGSAVLLGLAFVHLPEGRLYNGRILPAYYLSIYLLAAVALSEGLRLAGRLLDGVRRSATGRPGRLVAGGGAVAVFLAVVILLGMPLRVMPGGSMDGNTYRWMGMESTELNLGRPWVRWNFEGYEARVGDSSGGGWEEQRELASTMENLADEVGCGRLMWEYSSDLVRYGTPMALMLLPHWTDGCIGSMEGLYFEASTTTPYHFLVQSELSEGPSRAQRGLPYRGFDLDAGADHLRQLGVRWYSAFSERAVREARDHPGLVEKASSGPWTIFEVEGAEAVVALDVEPAVFTDVDHESWLDPSVEVFQQGSTAVPRTVGGPGSWQRVEAGTEPERRPLPAVEVTNVVSGVDSVSFRVDRVGVPVLVRTSYFPNWKVEGADGPWRTTPNLMVVVPTSEDVRLTYGRTPVDVVSVLLTLVGLLALVSLARRSAVPSEPATPENALFDVAAAGPDGDRRLDRWVDRRVANEPSEEPESSESAAGEHGES